MRFLRDAELRLFCAVCGESFVPDDDDIRNLKPRLRER
jgi:hypothetical protein